jgi:hypothetical protein
MSALCVVHYYAQRANHTPEALDQIRTILTGALKGTDSNRVGLRVMFAVDRVFEAMTWKCPPKQALATIMQACQIGLMRQKFAKVSEDTWAEQIAGRANLIFQNEFPHLAPRW